jgi:predicted DNA-binding transcriptional regulator AlpA
MSIAELLPSRHPESDPDIKMQARAVARRFGVSVRTLDRWLHKPHLAFPQPVMLVHDVAGRVCTRLWRLSDLVAWERSQAVNRANTEQ